ncbi:DUF2946 family protein [Planctomicrobium sp. SH668]|uniref:DUF2946 family protein n=1 Tax=Planctomicrobium sp. SH668 TaxID=3448126 RepID=UPI003F5B45B1
MSSRVNKLAWLSAFTSIVMLLGVQMFHSPLLHTLEHLQLAAADQTDEQHSGNVRGGRTGCDHDYSHGHSHPRSCSHSHRDSHENSHRHAGCQTKGVPCGNSDGESGDGSHEHSHDCSICSVLAQKLQPFTLPVHLVGAETVSEQPAIVLPEVLLVWVSLAQPRGPPVVG